MLLSATLHLVFDEPLEKVDVRELLGDGLLRADVERGENPGQPEILQFGHELMIQLHDDPPDDGKKSVTGRAKSGSVGSRGGAGGTASAT